jgi:hypothetical protein
MSTSSARLVPGEMLDCMAAFSGFQFFAAGEFHEFCLLTNNRGGLKCRPDK